MSNLVFRNNNKVFVSVLCLLVSVTFSCRKKIDHVPSSSDHVVHWRMVKSVGSFVTSMEVFNGDLYVAGTNYSIPPTLLKLTKNFETVNFHNGTFSKVYTGGSFQEPIINKLYSSSDRLYIGGNYEFSSNNMNATSLMYYDLNGNFNHIPLLTKGSSSVSSLCSYQNDLIVGGTFGTSNPLVTTPNTERIQNGVAIGLASFPHSIIGFTIHTTQLYALGKSKNFKKWNGGSWATVNYNDPESSDNLYSICSYNDELYLAGNFKNNVVLKKLNTSGNWENVTDITYLNSGTLKVIDNKLYLFGNRIYIDGAYISDVVVYDGNSWKPVGNITDAFVIDLVKHNGKLVCAISSQLYVYE